MKSLEGLKSQLGNFARFRVSVVVNGAIID